MAILLSVLAGAVGVIVLLVVVKAAVYGVRRAAATRRLSLSGDQDLAMMKLERAFRSRKGRAPNESELQDIAYIAFSLNQYQAGEVAAGRLQAIGLLEESERDRAEIARTGAAAFNQKLMADFQRSLSRISDERSGASP